MAIVCREGSMMSPKSHHHPPVLADILPSLSRPVRLPDLRPLLVPPRRGRGRALPAQGGLVVRVRGRLRARRPEHPPRLHPEQALPGQLPARPAALRAVGGREDG